MNLPTALVLSSVALGVGGVSAYLALAPSPAAQASETTPDHGAELARLRATVAELTDTVAELRRSPEMAPVAGRQAASISDDDLQRAIASYFREHGSSDSVAVPESAEATLARELGSPADIALLLAEASDSESAELWKKIVAAGLDDEVLAHFEALADAAPNDPEAQLAYGNALLGRCQEAGAGPEAGKYAMLADTALDRALEADPQHWEARFTKAVALSFWPDIFGKKPSAIQQFETLLGQQAGAAPQPHHAQTHLMLGTLYQQTGHPEKALETWQAGLQLFPDHADLASQIAMANQGG